MKSSFVSAKGRRAARPSAHAVDPQQGSTSRAAEAASSEFQFVRTTFEDDVLIIIKEVQLIEMWSV
jgi:hypothetical protein